MKRMYKYVIFDLDGTLLDTIDDLAEAGNYALERVGFSTHDIEKYKSFVGNGIAKLITRIAPSDSKEEDIRKIHSFFSEYYEKNYRKHTKPYDGIKKMLSSIKEKGVYTAIVTNKDHKFATELVRDFFSNDIDFVFGKKEGMPLKPDPYAVNFILKSERADKNEALYVGDSNVDIQTAQNAGIASCGVLWGFRTKTELIESGAEYIVQSVSELERLITQVGGV